MILVVIRSTRGMSTWQARPHQSTSVLSGISAPKRAKISFWRYSGRWSSNLETSTWAKRPAPAMLPSIGRLGALAIVLAPMAHNGSTCTIFSQRRQDFFRRAI